MCKRLWILSFAKNIATHETKVAKKMSNRYSQKVFDNGKKSTTDAIKTASKRTIQKTAEATGDLIGNKIADKKTRISKFPQEFHSKKSHSKELHSKNASKELHSKVDENEIEILKERYIPLEKRQQIIDESRLA